MDMGKYSINTNLLNKNIKHLKKVSKATKLKLYFNFGEAGYRYILLSAKSYSAVIAFMQKT